MVGVLGGVLLIHFSVDSVATGVSSLASIRGALETAMAISKGSPPQKIALPEGAPENLKHILLNPIAMKRLPVATESEEPKDVRELVVQIWETGEPSFRQSLPVAFPNTFGISYIFMGRKMAQSLKKFTLWHEYSHVTYGGAATAVYTTVIPVIALIHYGYLAGVYDLRLLWFGGVVVVASGIWGFIKPEIVADVLAVATLTSEERGHVAKTFQTIARYSNGATKIIALFRSWMARRKVEPHSGWIFHAEIVSSMVLLAVYLIFVRPATAVNFSGGTVFLVGLLALLITWIPRDRLARSQLRYSHTMSELTKGWTNKATIAGS